MNELPQFNTFFDSEPQMHDWLEANVDAFARGAIIFLEGHLGAGKTSFSRGLLRAMGYSGAVKSPTYTLMEHYPINGLNICHFDLYRLADPEELAYLGADDYLGDDCIWLVEWPDKGEGFLPEVDVWVRLGKQHDREGRALTITAYSANGEKLINGLKGL